MKTPSIVLVLVLLPSGSAFGQTFKPMVIAQATAPSGPSTPQMPRQGRIDQSTGPTNPNPPQVGETVGATRDRPYLTREPTPLGTPRKGNLQPQ